LAKPFSTATEANCGEPSQIWRIAALGRRAARRLPDALDGEMITACVTRRTACDEAVWRWLGLEAAFVVVRWELQGDDGPTGPACCISQLLLLEETREEWLDRKWLLGAIHD